MTPTKPHLTDATPLTTTKGHVRSMIIFIAVVGVVFIASLWFIVPFIIKHSGWPETIIGCFVLLVLGAIACGARIRATRILNCNHKYIGNYCPKCKNTLPPEK